MPNGTERDDRTCPQLAKNRMYMITFLLLFCFRRARNEHSFRRHRHIYDGESDELKDSVSRKLFAAIQGTQLHDLI